MGLYESGEMYLENIFVLGKKIKNVRAIDIVNSTNYSKPSVSRALGILKSEGFVVINEAGHITLTGEGEKIAKKIYERHLILTEFLIKLGVSKETASADACKLEHYMSEETFTAIKKHAKER